MILHADTREDARNESSALDLVVEDAEITAVFDGKTELTALLNRIREHATSFVFDPAKPGERDACRSLAYKVARSKTAIDGKGKEIVADIKKKAAEIDRMRKAARDDRDNLKKDVLAPVTKWEARQAEIDDALNDIVELRDVLIHEDATKIKARLTALERYTDFDFGHKEAEADKEIAASRQMICNALEKRKQYEAEQAELARLRAEAAKREEEDRKRREEAARKEREARIAKQAAEKAARETEERLRREREAAETRARRAEEDKRRVTEKADANHAANKAAPSKSPRTLRAQMQLRRQNARIFNEALQSITPDMLVSPEALLSAIFAGRIRHVKLEV
ncbi:MAG: hypothetical protein JJU00_14840 [Opitutales bacterium]|nr:hypothetical protein [Opitutales bacterium]